MCNLITHHVVHHAVDQKEIVIKNSTLYLTCGLFCVCIITIISAHCHYEFTLAPQYSERYAVKRRQAPTCSAHVRQTARYQQHPRIVTFRLGFVTSKKRFAPNSKVINYIMANNRFYQFLHPISVSLSIETVPSMFSSNLGR